MADTEHKAISLLKIKAPKSPPIGNFRAGGAMHWVPTHMVLASQDTVPPSARRVVAEVSKDGYETWMVDASTDPDDAGQYYPDTSTWRTVGDFYCKVTPGCFLEAHCVYLPAGMTEFNDGSNWVANGTGGEVRVAVTWTGRTGSRNTTHTLTMGGSSGTFGATPTGKAAEWTALNEATIEEIRPSQTVVEDPALLEDLCEWVEADITLAVRGGTRLHSVVIYEVPWAHSQDHDNTGTESYHAYKSGSQLPNKARAPMESATDGATYEEGRYGTHQMIDVADNQLSRLVPTAWTWTALRHLPADQLLTDVTVVTTSSSTFVDLFDSSITSWDENNPGFFVSAAYALIEEYNDLQQILRGRAAILPVRIVVKGQARESQDGIIRIQSSKVSWVDVVIPTGSETEVETFGFLEAQVVADQAVANCQAFIRSDGGELDVRAISVTGWVPA